MYIDYIGRISSSITSIIYLSQYSSYQRRTNVTKHEPYEQKDRSGTGHRCRNLDDRRYTIYRIQDGKPDFGLPDWNALPNLWKKAMPNTTLLTLTTWLVSFFYPFWGTMSVIGGIALLVIAKPLYEGKAWARGLALLSLAVPSMGGAYMIVPWMNFVGSKEGGFPPAIIIMMIGLIPYFAILLADKGDLKQKLVDFFVFMMLGVSAAENFANGHAAFRILYGHPKRPLFAEGISITYFGWLGLWVSFGLIGRSHLPTGCTQ